MNLGESGPQAKAHIWTRARLFDWIEPLSPLRKNKTVEMNLRRFDRAVSQPEVGPDRPVADREPSFF